ncbi:MAG: hypothetical protein V4601_01765 [Pseudomonadota bacterium]
MNRKTLLPPARIPALALILTLGCPAAVLAQAAPPSVAFAQVTAIPVPLQSTSGRFSSLNPTRRLSCPATSVSGRVVSPRLIMVEERFCGPAQSGNELVNVEFANPADAEAMVVGRRVTIKARIRRAEEARTDEFYAHFLIAENAALAGAEPRTEPVPAFTSYVMCQPPELDALAKQLGSELCVQNTITANLAAAGPALEAAARAPLKVSATDEVSGNPDAIICIRDHERSDIHLPAIACARGSYWAWYNAKWRDRLYSTPAPP